MVKLANCDRIFLDDGSEKNGQLFIRRDGNSILIEVHAGLGWRIGKVMAIEKGFPTDRCMKFQLIHSEKIEMSDTYKIERPEGKR